MICESCEAEGETSTVRVMDGEATCMGWFPFYDAEGRLHHHNPNTYVTHFACDKGHTWATSRKKMCLACGMWWLQTDETSSEKKVTEPMKLWRFEDAPVYLQQLSNSGGDEDWLLLVPSGQDAPFWVERNGLGHFGICNTDRYQLSDGSEVFIGCHA